MIDVRKLQRWRRADLEAIIYKDHPGLPGNIAGDIVLGGKSVARSIRFSIEQHDDLLGFPFVTLSAQEHTRCTDAEVHRFMRFARFRLVSEITSGVTNYARSFRIR